MILKSKLKFNCFSTLSSELNQYLQLPISKRPDPNVYEEIWLNFWSKNPSNPSKSRSKFSILLPPPNLTGSLHLGHALTLSIQDALARYKRQCNFDVEFIPGFDHAGIATYLIMDKNVYDSIGKRLVDLSPQDRDFYINSWLCERQNEIRSQLIRLGASCNFSKEYFTLDASMSNIVIQAFIKLYDQNLIYRDRLLVNWSYYLQSTISDFEIKRVEVAPNSYIHLPGSEEEVQVGILHYVSYVLEDGGTITFATRILESLPGDVAIAVNPNDIRYKNLIGKRAINPFTNKFLPIIPDTSVDPSFGTGAVKLTPSSNLNDFNVISKHNIQFDNYTHPDGKLKEENLVPSFKYLSQIPQTKLSKIMAEILKQMGFYLKSEPSSANLPICSRSGDIVVKRLLPQWFLKSRQGFKKVLECFKSGELIIEPAYHTPSLIKYCEHENDWCISRQIFWGHRIPVWKVDENDEYWVSARNKEEVWQKIKKDSSSLPPPDFSPIQEKDVLDTWFSSSILPFSIWGWPQITNELELHYPLSIMETGYDILGPWVLRMALMGLYCTNKLPFNKVIVHGMVVDEKGLKMSKSKGNILNPIHLLDSTRTNGDILSKDCENVSKNKKIKILPRTTLSKGLTAVGSDALRLALYEHDLKNQTIKFLEQDLYHNRNVIDKLWQVMHWFSINLANVENIINENPIYNCYNNPEAYKFSTVTFNDLNYMDKYILSCTSTFVKKYHLCMDKLELHRIYSYFHYLIYKSLSANYLESGKILIKDDIELKKLSNSLRILVIAMEVFKIILIMMHPFIPFSTEELFQRLKKIQKDLNNNFQSIRDEKMLNDDNQFKWTEWQDLEIENLISRLFLIKAAFNSFNGITKLSANERSNMNIKVKFRKREDEKFKTFNDFYKLLKCKTCEFDKHDGSWHNDERTLDNFRLLVDDDIIIEIPCSKDRQKMFHESLVKRIKGHQVAIEFLHKRGRLNELKYHEQSLRLMNNQLTIMKLM